MSGVSVCVCLDAMEAGGLIVRFEALGRRWMFWPGFGENQPYLRSEKEKTDFPPPLELGEKTLGGCFPTNEAQILAELGGDVKQPAIEYADLHELYAALGLATALCIESGWSKAATAQLDRAYAELTKAQERMECGA